MASLLVGLVVTGALAWAANVANGDSAHRLLELEVSQAAATLAGALPATQATLVADYEVADATRASIPIFKSFNAPEVGPDARFVSVSLWRIGGTSPRLLATAGAVPDLAGGPGEAAAFFARVHPSPALSVTGILGGPGRRLGYAEVPPGARSNLAVYAESALPPNGSMTLKRRSAFSDLNFALYLGRTQARADLLESSGGPSVSGQQVSTSVPFGDTSITLVGSQRRPITGGVSESLAWIVGIVGVILALAASLIAQGLVDRRRRAEGLAAENQRLYGEQRAVAAVLQHALLPGRLPEVAGVEVAVRYVAGVDGIDVGGDWYDLIPMDGGTCMLVIGDVSGRGLGAATTMASLRFAIRAYVAQGDEPNVVLDKLGELLSVERDGHFATAICGHVDVAGHRITLANAGHLPALLVDGDAAAFIEGPVGPPIGVCQRARSACVTVSVPAGATVLVVTDGLVERRGESIDEGLERLRHSVGAAAGPLDDVLGRVLGELVPRGSDDDIAMLGMQWQS